MQLILQSTFRIKPQWLFTHQLGHQDHQGFNRGASCSLTLDNDMHTLPNVIQLALLRIKTIDIPQLVREAVEPYKAKVNNLSEDVTSLRAQNERLQQTRNCFMQKAG